MKKDSEEFTNQRLPGTGGDFIDGNDVEGHKRSAREDEGYRQRDGDGYRQRDGDTSFRMQVTGDDNDVEGHRQMSATGDGAEALYRGGPSTQGEIIRRGPGDHPHGDR